MMEEEGEVLEGQEMRRCQVRVEEPVGESWRQEEGVGREVGERRVGGKYR